MCKDEFLKDSAKYIAKVDAELAKAKAQDVVSKVSETSSAVLDTAQDVMVSDPMGVK